MPKVVALVLFIALAAAGIIYFKDTPVIKALADNQFTQQIQTKISESKNFYQGIKKQSKSSTEYLAYLGKLNDTDFSQIKEQYSKIDINEGLDNATLTKNEAMKSITLTLARYESLNSFMYKIIAQIQTASQTVSDSGFDSSDTQKEIETLTYTLGNIEAQNTGIQYIKEKLQSDEIKPKEALEAVINISKVSKVEYEKVFSEIITLKNLQ